MKKITFLGAALCFSLANAQTFSDNFDSYTAGQKMASQSAGAWTTWSGAVGGAEDVMVSSADAVSAPNSIYFSSSVSGGGPTDLIKNFGVLNTGQFSMEFNLKVETGKAAYFNLQKTATLGQIWALDCNFKDNGTLLISNLEGLDVSVPYTSGTWFKFKLNINFNTNTWEILFDNVSKAIFANPINQIASIDIFPVDQDAPFSAGYFIDDFQYTITPYTITNLNASLTYVGINGGNVTGNNVAKKVKVRNLGTTAITSLNITTNYNGVTENKSFSALNIASLAEVELAMDNTITLAAGTNSLSATVSVVNGSATPDDNPADDIKSVGLTPLTPALGKMVVSEEGTGTWCQWCPRGAVFMDRMHAAYSNYWVGIAVHNGDPMAFPEYDTPIGAYTNGYPFALVDRNPKIDPSEMEPQILNRLMVAPTALISSSSIWNPATRELKVYVSADFQSAATNNYKLACALTEDGVTGTTSGYNQKNAYAGGASGPMGGYETKPFTVPAAQMVYDHVARAIKPSFEGSGASFPATVNAGETHTVEFDFGIIPADWDMSKMNVIGLLMAPDGKIDNAGTASFESTLSSSALAAITTPEVTLYPNPVAGDAYLSVNMEMQSEVEVTIYTVSGQKMNASKHNLKAGSSVLSLDTKSLNPGVYLVKVNSKGSFVTKRMIVK
ncbi:MAG: T9SS type A sorting domain-containing protein [Crocinitomicaceae bacterium]|nr:T9SS type A sorting domain-containing protein [Crocinitomicaceae bacterium]